MSVPRPLVSVYAADDFKKSSAIALPTVFQSPIRPDLVHFVHTNIRKNSQMPYAVKEGAGYQTSAESWGTGRAVARIPRVPGGGTHRAGQAAFGNMCRGGGMFAPTKIWRRWHRKIPLTQKRHAICSALAATAVPGLVMSRGHRINEIPELPLVISDDVQQYKKTKTAMALLSRFGCKEELEKVKNSRGIRPGKGKMRNRRYIMKLGPLIIYGEDNGIVKAFRNIPGVDICSIDHLNLLQLAPGGNVGRFVIWTHSAFAQLQQMYGTYSTGAPLKSGYVLPRPLMLNPDLNRLINSDEIQSVLRPMKAQRAKRKAHRNPLNSMTQMVKLNPAARYLRSLKKKADTPGTKEYDEKKAMQKAKGLERLKYRKIHKQHRNRILAPFRQKAKDALAPKKTAEENEME